METYDNIAAIIDIFNEAGIEHVFFNPGIDIKWMANYSLIKSWD